VVPLIALLGICAALVVEAYPAFRVNGWGFFVHSGWNIGNAYGGVVVTDGVRHPAGISYGAFPLIVGTLESSALALAIAVPVGVLGSLAIVKLLPEAISKAVGFFLELLAGVPSVVFGLWGALTLGPALAHTVYPFLANHLPNVAIVDFFKGPVGAGEGLFTSSVVLAAMVVPIVASTSRELLASVPRLTEEGGLALGMSRWEVSRSISLRWVRQGLIGAAMLGLARALGETMAVAMISGVNLASLAANAYSAFTTIAATIVSQLDSAFIDTTGFAVRSFAEAACVLVAITLLANIGARLLVRRVASGTALPVGRGI